MGVNKVSETSGASHIAQVVATMQYNFNVLNKLSIQTFQNQYPCIYIYMCVHFDIGTELYVTNENTTTLQSLASYAAVFSLHPL
jgi:hypothetical protein